MKRTEKEKLVAQSADSTLDAALLLGADTTVSMADRVYSYLIDSLADGTLRGGDAIQESRLAEQMNLSRTPIRDALARLEGEGLLVRARRTLTVRRVSVKEFLDLLHVRRLIEPEAAYLACGKIDPLLLQKWRSIDLAETVDDDVQFALDEEIHMSIVKALNNDYLADLVRNLRRRTRLFEMTEFPGHRNAGVAEHQELVDALISGDAAAAREAMLTHLDNLRNSIIERIRRM